MAHVKAKGSTKLGRDSRPKYLGVKRSDGQYVKAGEILVRQRGTKFLAGKGTRLGRDDTIYAVCSGIVKFITKTKTNFDGTSKKRKFVTVIPSQK